MKVEERPPPPEPDADEAVVGIPWSERIRNLGIQLLAPAISLLIAAVIGVLVILVVQQSWMRIEVGVFSGGLRLRMVSQHGLEG